MYKFIYHPDFKKKFNINHHNGQKLLQKYLQKAGATKGACGLNYITGRCSSKETAYKNKCFLKKDTNRCNLYRRYSDVKLNQRNNNKFKV